MKKTEYITEDEIKEAVLSLLYKKKPSLRPKGIEIMPVNHEVFFTMNSGILTARVELTKGGGV